MVFNQKVINLLKKTLLCSCSLLAFSLTANANALTQPNQHIPEGYKLFEKITGDLNNDGIEDVVLLVKATKKSAWAKDQFDKMMVDKNRRGLMIFLSQKPASKVAM